MADSEKRDEERIPHRGTVSPVTSPEGIAVWLGQSQPPRPTGRRWRSPSRATGFLRGSFLERAQETQRVER